MEEKEKTFFDYVIATLNKYATYVGDPRTITAVLGVLAILRMIGLVTDKLTDKEVSDLIASTQGLLLALVAFVTVLASVAAILTTWISGWTQRPSRGLAPFFPGAKESQPTVIQSATIKTEVKPSEEIDDSAAVG